MTTTPTGPAVAATSGRLARVGIVHAPYGAASLTDIRRAAVRLCHPVVMVTDEVAEREPDLVTMGRRLFELVVTPLDELADQVAKLDLAGLTTFHDAYLDEVDAAVARADLPGLRRARSPWDKVEQRTTLARCGLTRSVARAVDSPQDLLAAVEGSTGPWVLKPRRGVGGAGVAFVTTPEDVDFQLAHRRHWRGLLLETRLPDGRHPGGIGGVADFVSVETLNGGSGRRHLAVFDKAPVSVTRRAGADAADAVAVTGDITPSRLPAPVREQVCRYVDACLTALDIRWRVTHTEVKLTPAGPDIIEVNGRVGGHLNRLLRLVEGPDLVAVALSLAMGREPEPAATRPRGFAMGRFPPLPSSDGTVRSRVGAADLRALPGAVGVDEVAGAGQPRRATDFRMANVTLWAPTAVELDAGAAATAAGIRELFAADLDEGSA